MFVNILLFINTELKFTEVNQLFFIIRAKVLVETTDINHVVEKSVLTGNKCVVGKSSDALEKF